MKLWPGDVSIYRYTLRSPGTLNARSQRREWPGILIKCQGGYASLHPWPELGDAPLETQIEILRSNGSTPLIEAARACLQLDRDARDTGCSLFEDLIIPPSHVTIVSPAIERLTDALTAGFTKAKIKVHGHALDELAVILENSPLPLRIDLNGTGSLLSLCHFLNHLSPTARASIDFLEDPIPYDADSWQRLYEATGCPLALDRFDGPLETARGFQYLVLKPAAQPDVWERAQWAVQRQIPLVITSSMDHPVGQAYAAAIAGRIDRQWPGSVGLCGLVTHPLFQPSDFAEHLGSGPRLNVPPGTGLGFDDLLVQLPWETLG